MKTMLTALVAILAGGCATPYEIRQDAYGHLERAQVYEAQGDYRRASKERAAADRDLAKANRRAWNEQYQGLYRY